MTKSKVSHYAVLAAETGRQITIEHVAHATADEAIAQAVAIIGGDVTADDFVAEECTDRLFNEVEKNGGQIDWTDRNGLLDVKVDDEGLLGRVIDFFVGAMAENATYNSDSGLNGDFSASDAFDIYLDGDTCEVDEEKAEMREAIDADTTFRDIAEEEIDRRMAEFDARVIEEKALEDA